MITPGERERLRQFFGSYFHQDWDIEYGTPEQALSAAIRAHESQRKELGRLVELFVEEHPNDEDLDQELWRDLGCDYLPSADRMSSRAWLLSVAARLDSPTGS
jgi:hypothetical protein